MPGDENATKSRLWFGGRDVGFVGGTYIDAQYRVAKSGYLLFTSFNHIYCAIETIYFTDARGSIRDRQQLGDAMEQGLATDFAVEGPDTVRFQFPLNQVRRVRVARRSAWFGLQTKWLTLT